MVVGEDLVNLNSNRIEKIKEKFYEKLGMLHKNSKHSPKER
jgi:hypothetical protein